MEKQKHILIIAGEASGELHAATLVQKILEINQDIRFSGVGGKIMRQAGVNVIYDIADLSVLGFFDVLKKLPKFFKLQKFLLEKIKEDKPDLVILVDFSGFNLRLAKKINNAIPIIYYISPQVWASRSGRIKTIKEYIRKIIVFFKFEEELYKKYGIDTSLIGHPLLDIVKPTTDKKEFLKNIGFLETKTTIALLPGSRRAEVANILPVMLKSSKSIAQRIKDCQFIIAKSNHVPLEVYQDKIKGLNINLKVIEDRTYDCLNAADFCLVASGTATLETAIMQKPFVVIYKMGLLNYLLYLPQVKVPYIGMVNIVAGKKIVPEFIQFDAAAKKISKEVINILENPLRLEKMISDLSQIKSSLGEKGAIARAAQIIIDFLRGL